MREKLGPDLKVSYMLRRKYDMTRKNGIELCRFMFQAIRKYMGRMYVPHKL